VTNALVTAAIAWIALSYALGVVLAVDQLRRPPAVWEAAGRNRRFWVVLCCAMGFHGLGEYAAVAYLVGVVPRFRAAERDGPRRTLQQASATAVARWRPVGRALPDMHGHTAIEDMALVAALLVFVSSFIHAAAISPHFEQYWLYGAFFAVTATLQALWVGLILREPLNRRVLLIGAIGNAALIVVWAITRTAGVPVGPQTGPEAVGVLDVLSKLDELAAIVLIATVLVRLRGGAQWKISPLQLRIAAMVSGPLFLYSVLAAFGGHQH
jgi:hypothetical protein